MRIRRRLTYLLEAALAGTLFKAFRLLPLDVTSWLGGVIARGIGPFFSAHRIAKKNLAMVFPEKTPMERNRILFAMWDNLGRVAAELSSVPGNRLTSRLKLHGDQYLPTPENPAIFFSGHIGNWELLSPIAYDRGIPLSIIYRHINNPYIDRAVSRMRASHSTTQLPKGFKAAGKIVRAVKGGESLAMLVDQKMNTGIDVPFFGRNAKTATAIAEFALKFDLPIIPSRVIRTKGAHFEGHLYPPLDIKRTGDHEQDVYNIMLAINEILEGWIRERPDQWFWVHKRWPNA